MTKTNIEIIKGDTETFSLTIQDDDGAVVDITGWTLFFTCKNRADDPDTEAIISKTITAHDDPVNGVTGFVLAEDDTRAVVLQRPYDIQVTTDTGEVHTLLLGQLLPTDDVTKRTG